MDTSGSTLMGAHGYCSQELVNLLITGAAVSNTHDGIIKLGEGKDALELKGVAKKNEIGFLSLFEHYKNCQVRTRSHYAPTLSALTLCWIYTIVSFSSLLSYLLFVIVHSAR
mmetsp:Transcript_29036/g.74570  ORF Transcript_29036/g.74570 Transcript_29036/m.74570 type:complete len:112 (-) Transcript_29036:48-383(-)